MYVYGTRSLEKLQTCRTELALVAERALQLSPVDISVIHGFRGEELQNELFYSGASKKRFPESKHNATGPIGEPRSDALDFAPWIDGGIPWNDTHAFCVVAGVFFAAAAQLDVVIRWGGDWDMDGSTTDQTFMDWGHIEYAGDAE